jgi:uncharacterized membrane protein
MSESGASASDITSDDKLWALLTYLLAPIVPIIILLMEDKKNRPFIKAHNIQALIWWIFYAVIGGVLSFIIVGCVVYLAGIIFAIVWGIKAYQGNYVTIPVITDFVKKQGWA